MHTETNPMIPFSLRSLSRLTTALVSLVSFAATAPAFAQELVQLPVGANTETVAAAPGAGFAAQGFSISVDNHPIAGATPPYNPERSADLALAAADLDVRYDGLGVRRLLNVVTSDLRASYQAGEKISFRTSSNYPAYIDRAEIRILDLSQRGYPVVATIPAKPNGTSGWVMPQEGDGDYAYALRVFDAEGRYDETLPLRLTRSGKPLASPETVGGPLLAAGEGEDHLRVRHIPVNGGMITVSGRSAGGRTVSVMGEDVPVDPSGRFVVSRVLPAGDHVVRVSTGGRRFARDVNIPDSEWFYTGIVDVTAGYRFGGTSGRPDAGYVDGRVAAYAKGQMQNGWTITAGVDTQEGPVDEIFSRLADKGPQQVLDRMRASDDVYPTYGDASSWYDDTPTDGAVYLRAENDTTRFTWGNYKTSIASPLLLNANRDLYGAELRYQSRDVTAHGDNKISATLYASQPDTAPGRDILRGTGGSVYFLTHQDITGGSASVMVQVVDPDTGRNIRTEPLTEGKDYQVDYIQGVITLSKPLSWKAGGGGAIGGKTGDYEQNLVVQYEYTPTGGDTGALVAGGRAEAWVTDELRVGATGMREQTDAGTRTVLGSDIRYQFAEQSYAQFEIMRSTGQGMARSFSTDGGMTIVSTNGAASNAALGLAFDSYFDFEEMGLATPGHLSLYYQRKQAGFWTLNDDITSDQSVVGGEMQVELMPQTRFTFAGEHFQTAAGERKDTLSAAVAYDFSKGWSVEVGAEYLNRTRPGSAAETGSRLDVGATVTWSPTDDLSVYAFGQTTVSRTGGLGDNNRIGVGADVQLTDKLGAEGEVSTGSTGMAATAMLTYQQTPDREVYLGYSLDPTRYGAGSDLTDGGAMVTGGRYRFSDTLSVYGESAFDLPSDRQSLTNTYGVEYTPSKAWSLAATFEHGEVRDPVSGNFNRLAASAGAAWTPNDDTSARARVEYRTEDGEGLTRDRDTYMFSAGYESKLSKDWTVLADVEGLYSASALGEYHDGTYLRGSVGIARRPIDDERLNLLFMYSYLLDLPGEDQISADGTTDGPKQRSHVFSFNANYDLNTQITLGGKLGYRVSEIAARGTNDFTANTAALTALRVDWHVVSQWDVFGEGRLLYTPETGTSETGAVLGIYRHLSENAKIGVGYEWGGVSDDMTNINYQSQGLFLNLVGKF